MFKKQSPLPDATWNTSSRQLSTPTCSCGTVWRWCHSCKAFAMVKSKDHVKISVWQGVGNVVANLFTRFEKQCQRGRKLGKHEYLLSCMDLTTYMEMLDISFGLREPWRKLLRHWENMGTHELGGFAVIHTRDREQWLGIEPTGTEVPRSPVVRFCVF